MLRYKKYKIGPFNSKRKHKNEKGVTMGNFHLEWTFVDTNLNSSLNVILREQVYFDKGIRKATVFARVFYDSSKIKESQVKNYVSNKLEQIAKDGMAFPE